MNQSFPELEVYNYGAKPYISSIPHQSFAPQPPKTIIRPENLNNPQYYDAFKESQVNAIYQSFGRQPFRGYQPIPISNQYQPIQNTTLNQSRKESRQLVNLKDHGYNKFENQQERYDEYLSNNQQSYKYNIFSIIDQPWNRCLSGQKCNGLPDNQCITGQRYRKYWN